MVAEGRSSAQIGMHFGKTKKTIVEAVSRYGLGPWQSRSGVPAGNMPPPADFDELFHNNSVMALRQICGRSGVTIARWIRERGLSRPAGWRQPLEQAPSYFADAVKRGSTIAQLKEMTGKGGAVVRRWRTEALADMVVKPQPRKLPALGHSVTRLTTPSRGYGEEAATFMQRDGWIVYRCTTEGRQSIGGKFWRLGRLVVTDAELVERAERKGFTPNAWRQLVAA